MGEQVCYGPSLCGHRSVLLWEISFALTVISSWSFWSLYCSYGCTMEICPLVPALNSVFYNLWTGLNHQCDGVKRWGLQGCYCHWDGALVNRIRDHRKGLETMWMCSFPSISSTGVDIVFVYFGGCSISTILEAESSPGQTLHLLRALMLGF